MKSFVTVIILVSLIPMSSFAEKKKPAVVATVNGKKILLEEFEKNYFQNRLFVSHKRVTRQKVLNDMINRELGIQKAKKIKLQNDPIVKDKMEDVLYHALVSKELEGELKKIEIKDSEVKSYYKSFPEYRTAHILFRTQVTASPQEDKAAMQKAMDVYNKILKKPSDFTTLANKYTQTAAGPNGGDIGFQMAVNLAPQYFDSIKGKKPGYITPPVKTQFGYHIIKVLAVKDFTDIQKSVYKKILYDRKRDGILSVYFQKMRKQASIQINENLLN